MSDNPGISKQIASSVVCTTHDCFILSSLPRSCLCDTYCTKLHPLGICESWREASRAAGVCVWTVHVMSHEWPCMLESICLLETYSREGDVWSKSLVMVDLKTDRYNRSWDLLEALQIQGLCYKLRLNMGVKVDDRGTPTPSPTLVSAGQNQPLTIGLRTSATWLGHF